MASSPLPRGFQLSEPDGRKIGRLLVGRDGDFWLHALVPEGRALIMTREFHAGIRGAMNQVPIPELSVLSFGDVEYHYMAVVGEIDEISRLGRPLSKDDALPFARALEALPEGTSGAIFCRQHECMIPIDTDGDARIDKALALGRYLSGGVDVSAEDVVALDRIVTKMDLDDLVDVAATAGIDIKQPIPRAAKRKTSAPRSPKVPAEAIGPFRLPGRSHLEAFFNEHVVDIVANETRYAALGIGFPGGVILEGPTGCGKTFAVEKLVEHLGWRSFSIDASSVASPYIHETSRKVAEIFTEAIKAAPAVIVIDEMDAFLADRDVGTGHHRVEEVAEFLRRIPEASAARVLVIGMTNKIELIDPAILRRGRFDHVVRVDHAELEEIKGMLASLLQDIPHDLEDFATLSSNLAGRPLSDVAYVVREAGRLAARSGKDRIAPTDFEEALSRSPSRNPDDQKRIGF
ncbi:cell division protease FtsH [Sphingomonas sp. UYP23]